MEHQWGIVRYRGGVVGCVCYLIRYLIRMRLPLSHTLPHTYATSYATSYVCVCHLIPDQEERNMEHQAGIEGYRGGVVRVAAYATSYGSIRIRMR
jgi:hypothetical protein